MAIAHCVLLGCADDMKVEAHERLGSMLCQLSSMKKHANILTSDVLMSTHHVITKIKRKQNMPA